MKREYFSFFHKTSDWLNPKMLIWKLCSARMRKPLLDHICMCHCVAWLFIFFFLSFFFLQSTIIYLSTFLQAAVIYIYLKIVCAFFPPIHSMKEMFNLVHVVVMYLLLLFLHQISYLAVTKLVIYLFKACFFFISLILFVDIFKFKLSWHHLSFVLAIVTVQHFKQPDFTV